jgi:hypothetical protein
MDMYNNKATLYFDVGRACYVLTGCDATSVVWSKLKREIMAIFWHLYIVMLNSVNTT